MLSRSTLEQGQHVMTVCNACRYCEAYCPVFQAMENRTSFAKGDVMYLANLCHNCGECLYACQYAPPHEFGINVPRVLAEARLGSYEEYCWPRFMSGLFRSTGVPQSLDARTLCQQQAQASASAPEQKDAYFDQCMIANGQRSQSR